MGVTITVDEHSGVLEVPSAAILDLGEGPSSASSGTARPSCSTPKSAHAHEGWVAVAGTDLKEGEPVIVEGGYNLPEGTAVEGRAGKSTREHKDKARAGQDRVQDKAVAATEHEG